MSHTIAFLLFCLFLLARAIDITGHVRWNGVCRDLTALGYATASLDEGSLYGSITSNGNFTIPDVPDGTYILSFHAHDYSFDQFRVDVNHTSTSQVEVRPYVSGTSMNPPSSVILPFPILVTPKEKYEYFMPRESFNLGGMLSNPLMLAMIACGILVVATPYIMSNLDPEILEEFKKEQGRITNAGWRGPHESSNPSTAQTPKVSAREGVSTARKSNAAPGLKTSKSSGKKTKR